MSASPFRGTPDIEAVQKHLDTLKKLYHGSVRQVDAAIGDLRDWLASQGLTENTSIVMTADHGEQFLEHGGVQHSGDVYPELTHVPLIINDPDTSGNHIKRPCSLVDLPPTLLSLAGLKPPSIYTGRNLLDNQNGSASTISLPVSVKPGEKPRIAARNKRYTLVREPDGQSRTFDRYEDPLELSAIDTDEVDVSELSAAIKKWQRLISEQNLTSSTVNPSESVEEQLENLGYF
jgi:arylsulfatase A-like enzyme